VANFYGELIIRTTMDNSGVAKGVKENQAQIASMGKNAERSLGKTGLAMQNVGRTMTQYYTLPVAAGLGLATYMAYKYSKSMIQVQNLTGLSAKQAAYYSDEIRNMAAAIGVAPQAASEAFYFIASSGFTAAESVDALNISMKASVAGMGDVTTTADVITSAVNAWGHSNLTAAHAMDVLMRTIEVGKAEPQALAASLGRIMPVANTLGVGIEDLGGMIAGLTLTGLSSAEAVTSLRGTMMALVAPAKMSIDRLKTLGLTYQEVTRSIRDKGLLSTMEMLWQKTDGNKLAMREIIPNIRALNGVLSLLGPNYQRNLDVIAKVNDAQGKLNETYKVAAQTDVIKFDRAMSQLKSALIEVGQVMLPIVAMMVRQFGELVGVFAKMPPWLQKTTVGFLTLTAAAFPFISVAGSVIRAIALLSVKRAASVVASAAEVSSNAVVIASNQAVAGSELEVAAATAVRTSSTGNLAATLTKIPPVAGMGVLGIVGIGAAIVAATVGAGLLINKLKQMHEVAELRAILQPGEIVTEQFTKAFDRAAAKSGFDKVTVDGIVYYNYTIVPKPKGGEGAAGKRLAEQVDRLGKQGSDRLEYYRQQTEKLVSQVQQAAYKAGGANSIMALLGQDVETNKYRGLALRPIIKNITADIAALEEQRDRISRSTEIGKGRSNARAKDIASLNWWIDQQKQRLSGYKKMWGDVQEKMQVVQMMQPKWDYSKGLTGLRSQVKQYAFDIREFLGQPMKVPRIDLTANVKKFRGQLAQVKTYIDNVARSREITFKVKRERIRDAISTMNKDLDRLKRKGTESSPTVTAKIKGLTEAVASATDQLGSLKKTDGSPTVGLNGADQAVIDANRVRDAVNAIPGSKYTDVYITTHGRPRAWGGIIKKPEFTLVGEDGPEAIIPLTKPARAAQLLKESGLAKYTTPTYPRGSEGFARPSLVAVASEPTEVHYHNHLALPQGIVVSDVERFGRTVQPYVERGTLLARRRRARGRATL